uniref:Fibronectin type-III domain-containing protein n=1 Tax=Mesocestoides corti TaxID=53468 RepID=A0A5K3FKF5_MESCO
MQMSSGELASLMCRTWPRVFLVEAIEAFIGGGVEGGKFVKFLGVIYTMEASASQVCLQSLSCCGESPITWPDARHFTAKVDRKQGNSVILTWPFKSFSSQDSLISFSVKILSLPDEEVAYTRTEMFFGSTDFLPIHEIPQVRVVGEGPSVVILRDRSTQGCHLVIYNSDADVDRYSIEATRECKDKNRPKLAFALPMKNKTDPLLPHLKLLDFQVPHDFLEDMPPFYVTSHPIVEGPPFELDPPQSIYGVLNLMSPSHCHLVLRFRPPASNSKLIKNFTFTFGHSQESLVLKVVEDTGRPDEKTLDVITTDQLQRAQRDPEVFLEVFPKSVFEYPGNYTVIASTNNATQKRIVVPIIMPQFFPREPEGQSIVADDWGVNVKWGKPRLFGTSCVYTVTAAPIEDAGQTRAVQSVGPARNATFRGLSGSTDYTFTLQTNCTDGKAILTDLGTFRTNPEVPRAPANLRLSTSTKGTLNVTWEAPLNQWGHFKYLWRCYHSMGSQMSRYTTETHTDFPVGPGNITCNVAATNTEMHFDKWGPPSQSVSFVVPAGGLPVAPTVDIRNVNETAVELELLSTLRDDVLGFIVKVDSSLQITFFVNKAFGPMNVRHLGNSLIKEKRTGASSILLANLIPNKEHKVDVTTLFYAAQETTANFIIQSAPNQESSNASEALVRASNKRFAIPQSLPDDRVDAGSSTVKKLHGLFPRFQNINSGAATNMTTVGGPPVTSTFKPPLNLSISNLGQNENQPIRVAAAFASIEEIAVERAAEEGVLCCSKMPSLGIFESYGRIP